MNIFQLRDELAKRTPEESLENLERMEANLAALPPLTPEQRAAQKEMDRIMGFVPVRPAPTRQATGESDGGARRAGLSG